MIIVVACDVPLTENNGTAVAAVNLINFLREKGHTVRIMCPDEKLRGKENCFVTKPINLGFLNGYVQKNGVVISGKNKVIVEKALDGADELHTITPFMLCGAAVNEARKRGIPVTSGFHCQAENFSSHVFMMNDKIFNKLLYRLFYRTIYRKVDCIHYPTQFIRDTFEREIKKTTSGKVISNGVGAEFVRRNECKPEEYKDKFVILFTGRYSKEKSHKILIDAVAKSEYSDKIQLVFAGDGPLREKLEKYCKKKLAIQPVFGFHPREELVDIINYADLYVHPAEIEIEAIACLEAIKCGLVPVISDSKRSATRFFALDDKNLFKCNDSGDLAIRMDYWLGNPEERAVRSAEYMGYTEKFDRGYCMDEMEKMISSVAEKRHGA